MDPNLGARARFVNCVAAFGYHAPSMNPSVPAMPAMLDPAIRQLLATYFSPPPPPGPPDVAALRAAALVAPERLGGEPEPVRGIADAMIPGPAGLVPIRIYRPDGRRPLPLVVYAHGGGWVTGSLESHDKLCRILANRLAAIILAIDYRLAPEHPYPAALDDVDAVWRWVRREARALGSDPARHAVAGDSSGGNLVTALALRLRDRGESQPALQLLLYPALDAGCATESYREFADGFNLTAAQMRWYWEAYRGGARADDCAFSPLSAGTLAGLAPAVVAVATADVLRDDGMTYARRLGEAGVAAQLIRCDGMIHGFLRWTGAVPAALQWIDTIAAAARLSPGRA